MASKNSKNSKNSNKKTNSTRKTTGKLMTIPTLRSSFEQLEKKAMELKGKDKDIQVQEFKAAWKQIFGRDVSDKAIDAYLAVKHAEPAGAQKRKTRRNSRKHQNGGGVPLGGAPLDYQTRPGIDGVHGNFPAYVGSGLSFSNSINQIGRQSGGDLLSAVLYKPFASSSPPNFLQTITNTYKGVAPYSSSSLQSTAWAAATK